MRRVKALLAVTILLTGLSCFFWEVLFHQDEVSRWLFPAHNTVIRAIVAEPISTSKGLPLSIPSQIVAELCDLSIDDPSTVTSWDAHVAKFRACSAIRSCSSECRGNVGYIQYELRDPIFFVGGYDNCACDESGRGFPLVPIYPPMNLPMLFPSQSQTDAYPLLPTNEVALAKKVLQQVELNLDARILSIDLRKIADPSLYRREIVLNLAVKSEKIYIRLPLDEYEESLKRCGIFLKTNSRPIQVIDARFDKLLMIKYL